MKRFFSLALAVGIWAIYPTTSFSQSSQIGVTDLGDVTHSVAFRQVMKMLGNWEGKLYQSDGSPVETSTNAPKLNRLANSFLSSLSAACAPK